MRPSMVRVAGKGIMFSGCLSIRPSVRSVRYQIYEHDIFFKANEPISMQIGTSGLWNKDMKRSTFWFGLVVTRWLRST